MPPPKDVSIRITATEGRCAERYLTLRGWAQCGAKLVRIELSKDAQVEIAMRGESVPPSETVCVNPRSGCGIRNLQNLSPLLMLISS